ncbi:DUF5996 family protein [Sinobaca sp. H24]|uniref:DUF5996 family protein n=1 Tax=Sinobaca sp. H24 TaxID=2923376 RepID=UPI00207B0078|nr:DUF5996 family protein [Sinobaca sp. H24]
MSIIKHSDWKDTKRTLHLLSQILGKIRLELAAQEPQWAHVMLSLTPGGFSTGLLYHGSHTVQVDVDIRRNQVIVHVDDQQETTALENGKSVKEYYHWIFQTLDRHGASVSIYPKPQEMKIDAMLHEDTINRTYRQSEALEGLALFQMALREQRAFISSMRCRKVMPGLFWGTFDVSTLIVSDIPEPFPEDKPIEKAAFDEQFIEYGFWLGDDAVDVPSFFVLPYPFLNKTLKDSSLEPEQAYYDKELSEFFLKLDTDKPASEPIQRFFHTTFDILTEELGWEGCDYYKKPLLMKKQPTVE